MEGRVDIDKYGSALRHTTRNIVPVAQGASLSRPGTKYVAPVRDHAHKTRLVPFQYSALDNAMLNFSDLRMGVMTEDGPLLRASTAVSATVSASGFPKVTSAGHGASVGAYVFLSGYAATSALNNAIAKITAVSGDDLTLEAVSGFAVPTLTGSERVARIYAMTSVWTEDEAQVLRTLQSADTLFGFVGTKPPYSVARYGALDWRQAVLELRDGPYMGTNATSTRLTPSATGNEVPDPSITVKCTASSSTTGSRYQPENAFNGPRGNYWQANTEQVGGLADEVPSAVIIVGYTVYLAIDNNGADADYLAYAPLNWEFQGYNGSAWETLDTQADYVVWDRARSVYFPISNGTAYTTYRIQVWMQKSKGAVHPRIGNLVMKREIATAANITFTASSTTGINGGAGFQSTDVGRLMRFKGSDSFWRWYKIVSVSSATVIVCQPQGDPLPDLAYSTNWRLGLWSDTTGYPTCAHFFQDRMWLGGSSGAPDKLAYTKPGGYAPDFLEFAPTEADGSVTPGNGGVVSMTGKKVGAIRWISSDDAGILCGTVNGAQAVRNADKNSAMSAVNIEARPATAHGSADTEPASVDQQILFVQQAGRTLRELTADTNSATAYVCPSMSLYSTHLGGESPFARIAYTSEPHSVIWVIRADGVLTGFTYNRNEGVLGWHQHELGGADVVVEDIAAMTARDGTSDALWLIVKRTINGATKRYIEVMQPFWREGMSFTDHAHFFDCGLRYSGAPTATVNGLWHLEGQQVGMLADGAPELMVTVASGQVTLPSAASEIVIGLPFENYGETMRPNAGASDGTAQGKTKRIDHVTFRLWESQGGQYRRAGEEWVDFIHALPDDYTDVALPAITGDYGPVEWQSGYDLDGTIQWRQPGNIGLPINMVAIMPQLVVQDRG